MEALTIEEVQIKQTSSKGLVLAFNVPSDAVDTIQLVKKGEIEAKDYEVTKTESANETQVRVEIPDASATDIGDYEIQVKDKQGVKVTKKISVTQQHIAMAEKGVVEAEDVAMKEAEVASEVTEVTETKKKKKKKVVKKAKAVVKPPEVASFLKNMVKKR